MKTFNTKGFSLVEGLLVLIAVTLVAGVGFYVYDSGKAAEKRSSESAVTSNEQKPAANTSTPDGFVQYEDGGVSFFYPSEWTDQGMMDEGSIANYSSAKAGNINVYVENPRAYYSSNAPYLCQLNDDGWQDYVIASDDNGKVAQITSTEKVDVCEARMEKRTNEGNVIYETAGGALGQTKFISVVKVKGGYVVLANSAPYEPDTATEAEISALSDEVKSKVQQSANELARVN